MGEHGHPLFLAHGGQRQDAVHELAAACNQRHVVHRQLVGGEKLFERGGQVRLVCDDAVDQAALGQLGLGGGDNARPAARGRADGGIHRAAAQI